MSYGSPSKLAGTLSFDVNYNEMTASSYLQTFARPGTITGTALAFCGAAYLSVKAVAAVPKVVVSVAALLLPLP